MSSSEHDATVEEFPGHGEDVDENKEYQETPSSSDGRSIIGHSKIYTFASQFLCLKLQALALRHLTYSLQSADSQADCLPRMMKAAKHIYEHTQEQGPDSEPARALIIQFLVKNLESLNDDSDIIASQITFVKDLFRETVKRTTTAEKNVANLSKESSQKDEMIQALKSSRCKRCKRLSTSPEEEQWE
jgi:hypothetical protein